MTSALERHAADHAPSDNEFNRLLEVAGAVNEANRRIEDQFIVYAAGRLGLRSGELLHLNREWVDTDAKIIHIPAYDPCSCRYCQERVEELAENHEDVVYEEAIEFYWQPKYRASIRAIPYGFSDAAIAIVETFLEEVGHLDVAQSTVNRRVNTLEERAGVSKVYPHALRAAAGFYWAKKGLEPMYLQAFMGWKDMRVANRYIRSTGRQLNNRIQQLAGVGEQQAPEDYLITDPDDLADPTDAIYSAVESENPRSDSREYISEPSPENHPVNIEETDATTLSDFAGA